MIGGCQYVQGAGEQEVLDGHEVLSGDDQNVLEVDDGGCTIL